MRTLFGVSEMHKGVDLVGTDKTIVAPCDGKIGWAGEYDDRASGGRTWEWGNYVRLETSDGYAVYLCHMASVSVRAGQTVKVGDKLGVEGSTGKSTGSHCHFEVRKGGKSTDPTPYLWISNRLGSYPVEQTYNAARVCEKAGLEMQTKDYLDKYRFAPDLWRKLWEAMR
jgi:murein DD-endopeptidase MepM/ murein hydrolase activator NlpD